MYVWYEEYGDCGEYVEGKSLSSKPSLKTMSSAQLICYSYKAASVQYMPSNTSLVQQCVGEKNEYSQPQRQTTVEI
jgi:hypothetical protein